jgi:thiamine biosynthesis lipoprotein
MGSPCEIRLFAPDAAAAARALQLAVEEIHRLECRYSRYRTDSYLHEVNRAAAVGGRIALDEELRALLEYADTCHDLSDGLFDLSSGVLREAWRPDRRSLPEPAEIQALLPRIGWGHLSWDEHGLRFARPGMELDLGGLVKEYAADRAAAVCAGEGIRHGMVDLGGDIRVIGPLPDGEPWLVDIRHPRRPGESMARVELAGGALASSGDYERFFEIDGERHGHILSPRTGRPVRGLAAVSVIADRCVAAGSACTVAMLKERDGPGWLEELGLPHLWMDVDGAHGGRDEGGSCRIEWLIEREEPFAADSRSHSGPGHP